MVVHIGDICYANGYLSQWDQFTAQIEPIASTVPYMIGRSPKCLSLVLSYVPPMYSCILLTRRGIFAVVTMRGIGLAPVHSTEISTLVENVVSLPKPCSTLQQRTVQSSGNYSV
jgi:hypothetical protein